MIAPVIPGETLKNALVQARVETPLLKSSRTGWWYEMYFFYVKHRDMMFADGTDGPAQAVMDMHLGTPLPFPPFSENPLLNSSGQGATYARWCLNSVVHHYFRSEGEGINDFVGVNGLPLAGISQNSFLDSLTKDGHGGIVADDLLPGEYPVMPDFIDPMFEGYFAQWQKMTSEGFYAADFGDFLRSHGVKPPRELLKTEETLKPELLRYIRDWTMPQPSMVGASTGFNCRWDIAERIDKDRFFAEPGFVFGCAVLRPKVYMANVVGSMAEYMTTPYAWLPAVLNDEPYTSLMKFEAGKGPVPISTEDYWIDVKDLFLYGDTFTNFDRSPSTGNEAGRGVVSLPTAELRRKFVQTADTRASYAGVGEVFTEVDGIVTLDILGKVHDTSGHAVDGSVQTEA